MLAFVLSIVTNPDLVVSVVIPTGVSTAGGVPPGK